jgi:two-component system OmpR family sensor kinase
MNWRARRSRLLRSQRPHRLRQQLFAWLVLTIVITGLAIAIVFRVSRLGDSSPLDTARVERFLSARFVERWSDPDGRRTLAQSLAATLDADVRVADQSGRTLDALGAACEAPNYTVAVTREKQPLGRVFVCFHHRPHHVEGLVALVTACFVLWLAASALARKLTMPLSALIAVTRDIGAGNLKSRVRLRRSRRGELGVLAESINDMAERIERQLNEQRELLAAVSHEVRSPLARLRVSSELLRSNPGDERALLAIESEVSEIDNLVGKLLANSRLDFGSLTKKALDAGALAHTVCERRHLPAGRLEISEAHVRFAGDATLVARALDNLIDNAEQHGQGLARILIRPATASEHPLAAKAAVFEVEDRGAGFSAETRQRAFEAFFRAPRADGEANTSLGLGLALVERIARAHGGRAWAENLATGGARVGFSVGCRVPDETPIS